VAGVAVALLVGPRLRGYAVGVNYRNGEEEAKGVAADIRAAGSLGVAVAADVAREADVEPLLATVEAELGPLMALVANAGEYVHCAASKGALDRSHHRPGVRDGGRGHPGERGQPGPNQDQNLRRWRRPRLRW